MSLNEQFENYMSECEYVRRLRPATLRTSREAFRHFIASMPEIQNASDVTTGLISVFFKRLQTRTRIIGKNKAVVGIRDSTVASYASRLKTFFKWLVDRRHLEQNPFDGLLLPKPQFTDRRALTGKEIRQIMGASAQHCTNAFLLKRDMAMIAVLTFCGLRRTELISLELKDIDLFSGFLTVQPHTSKSKRLRKIPINLHLKMYLKEYLTEREKCKGKCPYLFLANGKDKRLELPGLKHWVKRISRTSGLNVHVHRFRHTFATNLAMKDVGVVKIQKLMGHADLKMTQTYLRSVSTEEMTDDINKLSFDNLS